MATYFIGDVHGCYDELARMLDEINYDSSQDQLNFTGDLVGRGPKPLEVLQLVRGLCQENSANRCVLGNHDLHLISLAYGGYEMSRNPDPTLLKVIHSQQADELLGWLVRLPLIYRHQSGGEDYLLVHAGVPHVWSIAQAVELAGYASHCLVAAYNKYLTEREQGAGQQQKSREQEPHQEEPLREQESRQESEPRQETEPHQEREQMQESESHQGSEPRQESRRRLKVPRWRSTEFAELMHGLYGDRPRRFEEAVNHTERLRVMVNGLTRLRMCNGAGEMELGFSGAPAKGPVGYNPWFSHWPADPAKRDGVKLIVFGHWAALGGVTGRKDIWALDYGCAWGRQLAAKRLEDGKLFLIASGNRRPAS